LLGAVGTDVEDYLKEHPGLFETARPVTLERQHKGLVKEERGAFLATDLACR